MSERIAKVESMVRRVVASALVERLGPEGARVTVTRVDVSPDMRQAVIWVGIIGDERQQKALLEAIARERGPVQAEVARQSTAKFVPHLHFKQDIGGAHAADIERLLRGL